MKVNFDCVWVPVRLCKLLSWQYPKNILRPYKEVSYLYSCCGGKTKAQTPVLNEPDGAELVFSPYLYNNHLTHVQTMI